jgi:hypothetical protein
MLGRRQICGLLVTGFLGASGPAIADDETKKRVGGVTYLELQTLTATVVRAIGRRGVLTVEAGLDIPNPGLRARALLNTPRLRAAYIQRLEVYAAGLAPEAPPDLDYLSRVLQSDTDRVLGRQGARFLLGAVLVN